MAAKIDTQQVIQALDVLNEALLMDPESMGALLAHRVPCNSNLAGHPSIQVRIEPDGSYTVGILGLINGILGADEVGNGAIAVTLSDDGKLEAFQRFEP